MSAQRGLPADSSAGRHGSPEYRVDLLALNPCCLMRSANLPEDLALPQNLGLESGGYAEEMPDGCLAIETGESGIQLNLVATGGLPEPRLEVLATRPVDLESVASGEDGGETTRRALRFQPAREIGLYKRHLLPHPYRRSTVAHPDDMKTQVHRLVRPNRRRLVRRTRPPALLSSNKQAARKVRPRISSEFAVYSEARLAPLR
jgi:hypothetical protein